MPQKSLVSTHIFMLPFTFNDTIAKVNTALRSAGWIYKPFMFNEHHENYNEFVYFYDHVREVLYNHQKQIQNKHAPSYYFETPHQRGRFSFKMAGKEGKSYHLNIVGVSLRTFITGVGILAIELENRDYRDERDILAINDFGRRLYPQFLSLKSKDKDGLHDVKGALLPDWVEMQLGDMCERETFAYYTDYTKLEEDATHLPSYINTLLGERFSSRASQKQEKIYIEPIIDDRMFVISLYMNDAYAQKMKHYDASSRTYGYEKSDFWYKFLFLDGTNKTCQSKHLCPKLVKEATYDRWVEWGTLFGITRYSFVALTGSKFGKERLEPHMRTLYFQIFTLLLTYRASLLHFSNRVAKLKIQDNTLKELQQEVRSIYSDYIRFQNNLLFREVTAQEQGIELFNKAYGILGIDKQVKDLDSEIAELHNYIQIVQSEQENQKLNKLNTIAGIFLPTSVISGIAGMNSLPESWNNNLDITLTFAGVSVVVTILLLLYIYKKGE